MGEQRYATGERKAAECRYCNGPIWIIYQGPMKNHLIEPRLPTEGNCGGTKELWTKPPEGHVGSMKYPCPGCPDCN